MKLYIDSSTSYLYLSIPCLNVSFTRSGRNDHSETLVDFLNQFLKEHNVNINDIKEVVIGRGPGSYTGLRIAGTVGKVLAYTKKLTFKSFSSLDLLLASKLEQDGNYIARIIAKKNHSYIKVVKVQEGKIDVVLDDSFVEDSVLEQYQEYQMIEPNDQIFACANLALTLEKMNLVKEESEYEYVPNYLRSGI